MLHAAVLAFLLASPIAARAAPAQIEADRSTDAGAADVAAELAAHLAVAPSRMAPIVEQFASDQSALGRKYSVALSGERTERMREFLASWRSAVEHLPFESFAIGDRVDWILLRNEIERARLRLERELVDRAPALALAPFAEPLAALAAGREAVPAMPARGAADELDRIRGLVIAAETSLAARLDSADRPSSAECRRLMLLLDDLALDLAAWRRFRAGYDPEFTWWTTAPLAALDESLDRFRRTLRERGVGLVPDRPDVIVGTPIGRAALEEELRFAWIPYTPEELIAIGEREFAWCEAELRRAADEIDRRDGRPVPEDGDWKRALELVKRDFVEPGEQPALIRALALEAIEFLEERDLVGIPRLARETWRMEMMPPAVQRSTPFFTGGEAITIAFPTDGMQHADKAMALRSNNRHFARATVHHELIPGHHLQQFFQARWRTHRSLFTTPFWIEGWALHWELRLWDLGFGDTPERRVGMLFWRLHRAARIVFSLKYHLGTMTAEECVAMLVDRVGHERSSAEGEVRRSVSGDYGPLYQAAYLLGGLQFRAMHAEFVGGGRMSERAFHDRILEENSIPPELVRVLLRGELPERDLRTTWRFDDRTAKDAGGAP
jgi:hypothetical protein